MPKRLTLHLSDPAMAVIGDAPDPSMSGRVNSILIRYGAITSRDCPPLTGGEWCFLADILNGTWLQAEAGGNDPARYLWAEAADAESAYAEKWGIDQAALVDRLRALPYAGACAIVEVVTRFWAAEDQHGDLAAQLSAAGARIEESTP